MMTIISIEDFLEPRIDDVDVIDNIEPFL